MLLNKQALENRGAWEKIGVSIPTFNVQEVEQCTMERPQWIHFGAGNIFRGFIARINQTLLDKGLTDTGIIVTDTFDEELIERIYAPHDNLALLVRLNADGNMEKEVIAGVGAAYVGKPKSEGFEELVKCFESSHLQMVSFTITEKGYALEDANGTLLQSVQEDITKGPELPIHTMSILTALMLKRFQKGQFKIALCSMDNCSHNGDKLKASIMCIASAWVEHGYAPKTFIDYLNDPTQVGFPWSMIDKITPRPAEVVQEALEKLELEGMAPIITSKQTFIAPFVNAEVPEYLVMEDQFPNGRPPLEEAGVFITDRETVNATETMKVTTCLNPLHTALAVYGCLLGYTRIYEEMKDKQLSKLVAKIGYEEGMKVVTDPKIICPKRFIDEVIEQRLPNPFIPDAPQRIATDTSQKVGIRYGETIKAYIRDGELQASDLTYIPLAIAGWLRYLMGVDDEGEEMPLSPDPLLDTLRDKLQHVTLGAAYRGELQDILTNEKIFGVNLEACGLGEKVEKMFSQMIQGKGAVRKTLKDYLEE